MRRHLQPRPQLDRRRPGPKCSAGEAGWLQHAGTDAPRLLVRFWSHDNHSVPAYPAPLKFEPLSREVLMGFYGCIGMDNVVERDCDVESSRSHVRQARAGQ